MPRYCSAIADDAAVARGGQRPGRRSGADDRLASYVCCEVACCSELRRLLRQPARAGPRLRRERGLPARSSARISRDLVLDRREKLVLLGELRPRSTASARRARRRSAPGRRARPARFARRVSTSLPVPLDRPEDPRVLARDALDRVEPRDDVVEALRAEDHLERRVALAVDVQIAEALGDAPLRDDEALPRGDEVLGVRREVAVDPVELDVRVVVRLDRLLEARVKLSTSAMIASAWARFDVIV